MRHTSIEARLARRWRLLIRRLRMRLGIPPERLQVICTSASFKDADYAVEFGAQLTGKDPRTSPHSSQGAVATPRRRGAGNATGRRRACEHRSNGFYDADTEADRLRDVDSLSSSTGTSQRLWDLQRRSTRHWIAFGPMAQPHQHHDEGGPAGRRVGRQSLCECRSQRRRGAGRHEPHRARQRGAAGPDRARPAAVPGPLLLPRSRGPLGLHGPAVPSCLPRSAAALPGSSSASRATRASAARACWNSSRAATAAPPTRARTRTIVDEPDFLWAEPGGAFRTLIGHVRRARADRPAA